MFCSAPGTSEIQLQLAEEESTEDNMAGSTAWIVSGIKIRDAQ